jgi:hypothetical protein
VAGDRDNVELYLEGMPLPPERLEELAREVEGVSLLTGGTRGVGAGSG